MGIVPCCDSRHQGFGTLRESMYCAMGIAGRGWLPVRCPHPRSLALAVHTGTVPLATILRVFRLVPGHQGGSRRGGGGRGLWEGGLGGGGQAERFRVGGGDPGGAIWGGWGGGAQASLTSPCPPCNHTITINLPLTFAASWFVHANHVDWAEQDPENFFHGCFCHIIALHFGPQHSL